MPCESMKAVFLPTWRDIQATAWDHREGGDQRAHAAEQRGQMPGRRRVAVEQVVDDDEERERRHRVEGVEDQEGGEAQLAERHAAEGP